MVGILGAFQKGEQQREKACEFGQSANNVGFSLERLFWTLEAF
jgi:hypothetical protein